MNTSITEGYFRGPADELLTAAERHFAKLRKLGGCGCGGIERECPRIPAEVREDIRAKYAAAASAGEVNLRAFARDVGIGYQTIVRFTADLRGVKHAPRKPYQRLAP